MSHGAEHSSSLRLTEQTTQKRHRSESPGNSNEGTSKKTNKSDLQWAGLFEGAEKFEQHLVSVPALNEFLVHEWPLWMRQFSVFRVYQSPLDPKYVQLFHAYRNVRPLNEQELREGLEWEQHQMHLARSALRVSRMISTCKFLRLPPNTNVEVWDQLMRWELDYRMYFTLNYDAPQVPPMPDNVRQIEQMIVILVRMKQNPTNVAEPRSIDPVPASLEEGRDAGHTKIGLHIRQLVEASIVHDMSHVEGLDSIKDNHFAKKILSSATYIDPSLFSHQCFMCEDPSPDSPALSVCLTGPNGTGKTSLLMAAVKESGRQLIMLQSSILSNALVGDSEKVLQEVFRKAVELAPSVILFDEVDKLFEGGTYRDSYMARVEGDLLQLWSTLIRKRHAVVILAATSNLPKVPKGIKSRFGQIIKVDVITHASTSTILKGRMDKFRHSLTGSQINKIARRLSGLGAREIDNFITALKQSLVHDVCSATAFEKNYIKRPNGRLVEVWVPCDGSALDAVSTTFASLLADDEPCGLREISNSMCEDLLGSAALKREA
ncbi:MAG: hypothetical protein Q9173_000491 [Seirophora scorigena]